MNRRKITRICLWAGAAATLTGAVIFGAGYITAATEPIDPHSETRGLKTTLTGLATIIAGLAVYFTGTIFKAIEKANHGEPQKTPYQSPHGLQAHTRPYRRHRSGQETRQPPRN